MQTKSTEGSPPSVLHMAFGDGTAPQALATAAVVGSVLTAINHGDVIVAGTLPPLMKIFLTYCVPYCVTTWGAVIGKRAQWRRDQTMRHAD